MIRKNLGRGATLVLAVGSALALATGPAFAALTVTTNTDMVTIVSDSGADTIGVSCLASQAAVNGSVALPALACGVVKTISVGDAGGSDTVNLTNAKTAFPALTTTQVNVMDAGSDFVVGSAGRDEISADFLDTVSSGAGNDRVDGGLTVDGGDGDDVLADGSGSVQGGPGNDRIIDTASGPLDGGPGEDSVELDFTDSVTDLGVTLAIADNGMTISAPTLPPTFVVASNLEQWIITMVEGVSADTLDSRTYSGRMVWRGLGGNDTFLGGAGPDYVDAGNGNDSITPGGGSDAVHAGEGNDVVSVRDGVGDVVDCGGGTDSVTADRSDTLSNCESVSLPAPETDKIAGPKKLVKGEKATFTFGSPTSGAAFECQVDKGAFKACSSPFKVKTKKLKTGKHTLTVRAVQPAGNADPTPSAFTFKVVAKK
jgi:Ca2+-binding RTX toxin-like protein